MDSAHTERMWSAGSFSNELPGSDLIFSWYVLCKRHKHLIKSDKKTFNLYYKLKLQKSFQIMAVLLKFLFIIESRKKKNWIGSAILMTSNF